MKSGSRTHTQQNTPHAPPPNMAGRWWLSPDTKALAVPALLLIVAVTLAYMNSLSGPFIFDDLESVTHNEYIRSFRPLKEMLFNAIPDSPPAGRPVISLSLAINYALGGLEVRGYHLFNITVHIMVALTLWGVLRQTLMNTPLHERFGKSASFFAFAIALLWAVHPLQSEAVTYISLRTELLMGLFYGLTLYCAIRAWNTNSARFWSVLSVVSCAIGMGCKEAMVSAPLMVLFYDVTLISSSWCDALRKHLKLYIGLAATWGLLAWFNLSGPRVQTCGWELGLSPLDYLRTQADIIVWYLRLCFWPHPLVISYEGWPLAKSFAAVLPQGIFIVTLLALTAWALWRRLPAALLGTWFFMILAPTSSIIPIITEIAAERRMYLPSMAVIIAVVVTANELIRLVNRRRSSPLPGGAAIIAPVVLAFLAIALGMATSRRNRDYHSAIGIWTDAVNKRPDNYLALANYGSTLSNAGEHLQAINVFTKALELKPYSAKIYESRGNAYAAMNDFGPALQDFSRAIELRPDFTEAYFKRGSVYGKTGDLYKAIEDYTRVIELRPDYEEAYLNRGIAFGRIRNHSRAIADLTRMAEFKPDSPEAYYNRGISYGMMRDYDRAIQDYAKAIELQPDNVSAYTNRGNAYLNLGDPTKAIQDHSKAIELKPDYARPYNNRASAYYSIGEYDKARADIEKCQLLGGRVNPEFIKALAKVSSQPS